MAAMDNNQLTQMIERINEQIATISTMQENADAAQAATAQALAELTQAAQAANSAMDLRMQQCEITLEAIKTELKAAQESRRSGGRDRLMDIKAASPGKFGGNRRNWRTWARTMKAYMNVQFQGARKAMEKIEKMALKPTNSDLEALGWKDTELFDKGLYDVLLLHTEGEPQQMIINSSSEEGFAAWKKLANFYEPRGGESDVDRLNNLLTWPRAKKMEQVASTVESWETALAEYVERTEETFPDRFKVNLLLRMIPTDAESEIRMRHVTGKPITYEALREVIESWIVQMAHRTVAQHLDNIQNESDRRESAGQDDEDLDALRTKGGERGLVAKPKAKAKAKAGQGEKFDGECLWCNKKGHRAKECRARIRDEAAGIEKAKLENVIKGRGRKGGQRGAHALEGEEQDQDQDEDGELLGSMMIGHDSDSEDGDFGADSLEVDHELNAFSALAESESEGHGEDEDEELEDAESQEFEKQCQNMIEKAENEHEAAVQEIKNRDAELSATTIRGSNEDKASPQTPTRIDSVTRMSPSKDSTAPPTQDPWSRSGEDPWSSSTAKSALRFEQVNESIKTMESAMATPTKRNLAQKFLEDIEKIKNASTSQAVLKPAKVGIAQKFLNDIEAIRNSKGGGRPAVEQIAVDSPVGGGPIVQQKIEEYENNINMHNRVDCGVGTDMQIGSDIVVILSTQGATIDVDTQSADEEDHIWSEIDSDEAESTHPEEFGDCQELFEKPVERPSWLAEVTEDVCDGGVLGIDAFDEEDPDDFRDPSTYASNPKKLEEYELEDTHPIPAVQFERTNRGRKKKPQVPRRLKHRLMRIAGECDCCDPLVPENTVRVSTPPRGQENPPRGLFCSDPLVPEQVTLKEIVEKSRDHAASQEEIDHHQTTESGTGSLPAAEDAKRSGGKDEHAKKGTHSGETRVDPEVVHALIWTMTQAIIATAVFAPVLQEMSPFGEAPAPKKSAMEKLKDRLAKMVKVRRGLTVDSGAADHVLPISWLTWIVLTASLGSLRGLHYISASGGRLPNLGQRKVDFWTQEGTFASLIFQVAGINKPLLSVSKLIDDGWRVVFDLEECYLLHKETRKLIKMKRERGVFVIDAFVEPEPGFTRQA